VRTDACEDGYDAVLLQQGKPLAFFGEALAPQYQSSNREPKHDGEVVHNR